MPWIRKRSWYMWLSLCARRRTCWVFHAKCRENLAALSLAHIPRALSGEGGVKDAANDRRRPVLGVCRTREGAPQMFDVVNHLARWRNGSVVVAERTADPIGARPHVDPAAFAVVVAQDQRLLRRRQRFTNAEVRLCLLRTEDERRLVERRAEREQELGALHDAKRLLRCAGAPAVLVSVAIDGI